MIGIRTGNVIDMTSTKKSKPPEMKNCKEWSDEAQIFGKVAGSVCDGYDTNDNKNGLAVQKLSKKVR